MIWHKAVKAYRLIRGAETCCDHPPRTIGVAFMPWWPGTFYQARLVQDLAVHGVHVQGRDLSLRSLLCLLSRRECDDVIHVHWPHGTYVSRYWRVPFVVLHLWLYRMFKNNVVWTVHELEFYETHFPTLDRIVVHSLLKLARALVVHSDYSASVVRERYGYRGELRVLRHPSFAGCYPNTIGKQAARRSLDLPDDAFVYLFLGHIKPYKGVEGLIAAFRALHDPRLRLVIAGKPLDERLGRRIGVAAARDPRIAAHIGYLPDERLQVYMNAADVVVCPFRRIHTSASVILGMSFGRPVIMPRIAALPEDVPPDAGMFFDPEDPNGLQTALVLAQEADLETMGRRARESVEGRTWRAFALEHSRLYRDIAPVRARARARGGLAS
ncbi:MAG: glycosyltransferase [Sulfurifustaceae bacterium]